MTRPLSVAAIVPKPAPSITNTRRVASFAPSKESAEIKRLKAENRQLREDVMILKAATTFFAGELDPRNR